MKKHVLIGIATILLASCNGNTGSDQGQMSSSSASSIRETASSAISAQPPLLAMIDRYFEGLSLEGINANKHTVPFRYPNAYDNGDNEYPSEPIAFHILSIPFHQSKRLLRVYAEDSPSVFLYAPETKTFTSLGNTGGFSAANYGGVYLPFAITKDDRNIILDAWMRNPGAGGGSIDLGYAMIPLKPIAKRDWLDEKSVPFIATRSAKFYDSYGKVVYVAEGKNTPHYSMPGPSNDGSIVYRDLVTNKETILLEEKDTSYKIVSLDKTTNTLTIKATKYAFSSACPRGENQQICAQTTVTERVIALPR